MNPAELFQENVERIDRIVARVLAPVRKACDGDEGSGVHTPTMTHEELRQRISIDLRRAWSGG